MEKANYNDQEDQNYNPRYNVSSICTYRLQGYKGILWLLFLIEQQHSNEYKNGGGYWT